MCRIVGGWEFGAPNALKDSIIEMRDCMRAGGPDDAGVYCSPVSHLALAHRRLSIIDLSSFSHQPFVSDDGRFVLVFNGEIYNYKDIAKELQAQNVAIDATSDTQVLLASFVHWGVRCVDYCDGMFAFCVYDTLEQVLYCFRDRAGAKPLYYYFDGTTFLFASELKALFAYPLLKKKINTEALSYFLSYGYIPAPLCILESCFKLEAGSYVRIDNQAVLSKTRYYNPKNAFLHKQAFNQETFESLLQQSVALRMVSDVPVGVCLSGGVDSSLVCAVLKQLGFDFETFSVGFDDVEFNESEYAKRVAQTLGLRHTSFLCSLHEAQEIIPRLSSIYDEPFGDTSAIPSVLLSSRLAMHVKVALSADGGDELGLGYERYFWASKRWESYTQSRALAGGGALSLLPTDEMLRLLQKHNPNMGLDKFLRIKNQLKAQHFMQHYQVEITHLRKEERAVHGLCEIDDLHAYVLENDFDSMSYFDFCHYLSEDILSKTDRASMSVGLEMREPLLGKDFIDYCFSMPVAIKTDGHTGKLFFKAYLENFLPRELIYRPKMGFGIPLEGYMRKDLRHLLNIICDYDDCLFNREYAEQLLRDFDKGLRVDFAKIWYLYVFCAWRNEWKI